MLASIVATLLLAQPQAKPPKIANDKFTNITIWSTDFKRFRSGSSFGYEFRHEFQGKEPKERPKQIIGYLNAFRKAGSDRNTSQESLAQWGSEKKILIRWREEPVQYDVSYEIDKRQDSSTTFFVGKHINETAWFLMPMKDFEELATSKEAFIVIGQDRFTLNSGQLKPLKQLLDSLPKAGEEISTKNSGGSVAKP
jgi:hypothetical protein